MLIFYHRTFSSKGNLIRRRMQNTLDRVWNSRSVKVTRALIPLWPCDGSVYFISCHSSAKTSCGHLVPILVLAFDTQDVLAFVLLCLLLSVAPVALNHQWDSNVTFDAVIIKFDIVVSSHSLKNKKKEKKNKCQRKKKSFLAPLKTLNSFLIWAVERKQRFLF